MYDCVICNQATPSTDDRPLGLVALLQPTSGQYSHGGLIVCVYHPGEMKVQAVIFRLFKIIVPLS